MHLFGGVIYTLMIAVLAGDYARKEIRLNKPRFLADCWWQEPMTHVTTLQHGSF